MRVCAGSISPPFPKFPDEFYTGIDVNIVNKGYSYTVYESYDRSCDAALQEILLPTLGHTRYLYDYKNQKLWTIRQGTPEKPGGTCSSRPLDPKDPFVKEDGVHLTNAQHFLGLNPNSEYQTRESEGYPTVRCAGACDGEGLRPGHQVAACRGACPLCGAARSVMLAVNAVATCRGVPVDTYSNFNNFRDNQTDATLSLGVKYKFAVPSWRSGARTDFRPLQEVELFGAREAKADNDKPRVRDCLDALLRRACIVPVAARLRVLLRSHNAPQHARVLLPHAPPHPTRICRLHTDLCACRRCSTCTASSTSSPSCPTAFLSSPASCCPRARAASASTWAASWTAQTAVASRSSARSRPSTRACPSTSRAPTTSRARHRAVTWTATGVRASWRVHVRAAHATLACSAVRCDLSCRGGRPAASCADALLWCSRGQRARDGHCRGTRGDGRAQAAAGRRGGA